jgi:hypothetical protein
MVEGSPLLMGGVSEDYGLPILPTIAPEQVGLALISGNFHQIVKRFKSD